MTADALVVNLLTPGNLPLKFRAEALSQALPM
jgi:hypothetical protein